MADGTHTNNTTASAMRVDRAQTESQRRAAWPATGPAMCVALIGWAHLPLQAAEGSGYNLSASELAAGLTLCGHRVFSLRSGMHYTPTLIPRIRRVERWRGVECFELLNSPNLSPAFANFRNTRTETACPRESKLVLRWLDRVGAEVVHIHSMEGYGLDLISAIRSTGRPVVVTLHNYWFVCPQVDLLHAEREVCMDYDGGRKCEGCLKPGPTGVEKLRRLTGRTLDRIVGYHASQIFWKVMSRSMALIRRPANGDDRTPGVDRVSIPAQDLAAGFDLPERADREGEMDLGLRLGSADEPKRLGRSGLDQNERFLKGDHHLNVLNDAGRRRIAGVEALNHASLVTPPSDFVRRVHVRMGVDERRTRRVLLGQPHFDLLNRRARLSPFYDTRPWDPGSAHRPLRFGFFGTVRANKGLEILVSAIPLLGREVRRRCQFLIHAAGWDWPFRKRLSVYPEVSFKGGYDVLHLLSAWGEYDVGVLSHVWFENSPLVMLEHLHAGKFVLCPRLGGPPEWIKPPANGLLYPAGSPEALADCITRLVEGGVTIPSPRQIHDATPSLRSYPEHVREVESIYREVLGQAPAPEIATRVSASVAAG